MSISPLGITASSYRNGSSRSAGLGSAVPRVRHVLCLSNPWADGLQKINRCLQYAKVYPRFYANERRLTSQTRLSEDARGTLEAAKPPAPGGRPAVRGGRAALGCGKLG